MGGKVEVQLEISFFQHGSILRTLNSDNKYFANDLAIRSKTQTAYSVGIAKHKHSAIGKHLQEEHRLQPTNLQDQFTVLKKCRTKFDCLIYDNLFIRNIKPKLNTQSDSVRAKLFA